MKRYVLILGTILCCSLGLGINRTVRAAQYQLAPGVLTIHLEPDRQIYQVSEPIRVRISIRNSTSEDYVIASLPPWALCDLTILNDKNEPLLNKGILFGYRMRMAAIRYPAGSTQFVGFAYPRTTSGLLSYWAPISYWGYHLERPGTYTITAVPNFTTFAAGGPEMNRRFALSTRETSNAVRIQIVK